MIIWIIPSIISASLLVIGYLWTRRHEQELARLIPAPAPAQDLK